MKSNFFSIAALVCGLIAGCHSVDHYPDTGHRDLIDAKFGRRHTKNLPECVPANSLYCLAEELTEVEDAIRRDGTITVKQPDVWGDGNLTHFIQEYDRLMSGSVDDFEATLQAYIARSDQMEVQSATAIGLAATDGQVLAPVAPASSEAGSAPPTYGIPLPDLIDLEDEQLYNLVTAVKELSAAGSEKKGIGVEPTELERQKSTYINVNQALRRRNLGGDNAQAAGYGLYKFRVPISVLPGRETTKGYMAVATLRAQLHIDEANLRNAFPRLVIADLVNDLASQIRDQWGSQRRVDVRRAELIKKLKANSDKITLWAQVQKNQKKSVEGPAKAYSDLLKETLTHAEMLLECCEPMDANRCCDGLIDRSVRLFLLRYDIEQVLMEPSYNDVARCEFANLWSSVERLGGEILLLEGITAESLSNRVEELTNEQKSDFNEQTSVPFERFEIFMGDGDRTLTSLLHEEADEAAIAESESASLPEVVEASKAALDTNWQYYQQRRERVKVQIQEMYSERTALPGAATPPIVDPQATPSANFPIALGSQNYQDVDNLRIKVQEHFAGRGIANAPKILEIREFLSQYLTHVHLALEERHLYSDYAEVLGRYAKDVAKGDLLPAPKSASAERRIWLNGLHAGYRDDFASISWLVASQAAITDLNVKRLIENLYRQGKICEQDYQLAKSDAVFFFAPDRNLGLTLQLWRTMVEQNFPIHVFALDPQVEEQNAFDALNRRRELQLALAIGVASQRFGLNQRLAASRNLGLDIATIDLNRTIVGFTHGHDTFGWYFRPRVQAPPPERSNVAAFARTLWSGGPTDRYELRNRELEPGIRECEVIVVMPSFVSQVDFDVTTNWEKVAKPGVTKRSYEEMIALGARVHRLQTQLCDRSDEHCFRPGDYSRLLSRVEQLERMLALQTYECNVPYEYEISGTDLFNKGDTLLKPALDDFYGLDLLSAKDGATAAHFFILGRNFHPTLTHVVIGGSESHTLPEPKTQVEVINRRLIKVEATGLNADLTNGKQFKVRVGTPAGLSNALTITEAAEKPKTATTGWKHNAPDMSADYCVCCGKRVLKLALPAASNGDKIPIKLEHAPKNQPFLPNANGELMIRFAAKAADGSDIKLTNGTDTASIPLTATAPAFHVRTVKYSDVIAAVKQLFDNNQGLSIPAEAKKIVLAGTLYVRFDQAPVSKLTNELMINVDIIRCDENAACCP